MPHTWEAWKERSASRVAPSVRGACRSSLPGRGGEAAPRQPDRPPPGRGDFARVYAALDVDAVREGTGCCTRERDTAVLPLPYRRVFRLGWPIQVPGDCRTPLVGTQKLGIPYLQSVRQPLSDCRSVRQPDHGRLSNGWVGERCFVHRATGSTVVVVTSPPPGLWRHRPSAGERKWP